MNMGMVKQKRLALRYTTYHLFIQQMKLMEGSNGYGRWHQAPTVNETGLQRTPE